MAEPSLWTWTASDGYPILVASYEPTQTPIGRVVVLHGVQSHQGWYQGLGRRLSDAGFEVHMPDRRGSGGNSLDRGHTPSPHRLLDDLGELLTALDEKRPGVTTSIVGISWGGKLATIAAGKFPDRIASLALICPGMKPRVGVRLGERLRIAFAYFTNRRKTFEIPLSDPALFTSNPEKQAFIANDPLGLRRATAGLLAASALIDRQVARVPRLVRQPVLLMLASEDRIVDNSQTKAYVERLASNDKTMIEYPGAHHTLEFEPDPGIHTRDLMDWLRRIHGPSTR